MKLLPKNKGYCLLEVDEMVEMSHTKDIEEMVTLVNESGASRKSFNTWLFPTISSAEEFVFMYQLKYEN